MTRAARPSCNQRWARKARRNKCCKALGVVAAAVAISQAMPRGSDQAFINAAYDCVKSGDVCLAHCLDLMATCDKSLGDCAQSVNELRVTCGALGSLAAQSAPSVAKLASVASDVCKNCEAACRKHGNEHAPCNSIRRRAIFLALALTLEWRFFVAPGVPQERRLRWELTAADSQNRPRRFPKLERGRPAPAL